MHFCSAWKADKMLLKAWNLIRDSASNKTSLTLIIKVEVRKLIFMLKELDLGPKNMYDGYGFSLM
ncbi:hypothetical protein HRM2_01650 [Desulforapulum autotrophicum HRM2]|uniref:Uncharacterized protein n=1 Tax=Desulforapulum autotrophicum (strain ATCC 43914 / DSM 3382 / VKM B-1955 / HRM2) TaxID=177437 RepID=C0QF91_DESAH|nr:hypothetical protein HRM2_01650 [Desulforapulum autotrophicum HRM2]